MSERWKLFFVFVFFTGTFAYGMDGYDQKDVDSSDDDGVDASSRLLLTRDSCTGDLARDLYLERESAWKARLQEAFGADPTAAYHAPDVPSGISSVASSRRSSWGGPSRSEDKEVINEGKEVINEEEALSQATKQLQLIRRDEVLLWRYALGIFVSVRKQLMTKEGSQLVEAEIEKIRDKFKKGQEGELRKILRSMVDHRERYTPQMVEFLQEMLEEKDNYEEEESAEMQKLAYVRAQMKNLKFGNNEPRDAVGGVQ